MPSIRQKMDALMRVGLGYIKVGQPGHDPISGEAQRGKCQKNWQNDPPGARFMCW